MGSTRHRFMSANLRMAKNILQQSDEQNYTEIYADLQKKSLNLLASYIYQTDAKLIGKLCYDVFLNVNANTLKKISEERKQSFAKLVQMLAVDKIPQNDPSLKESGMIFSHVQKMFSQLGRFVNFDQFEETMKEIRADLSGISETWKIEESVLEEVLERIDNLVKRPIPIKYATRNVLNQFVFQNKNPRLILQLLNEKFHHLLLN